MKKFLAKEEILKILGLFISWKIIILLSAVIALNFIPLYSNHLLGGGLQNYEKAPLIFGWGNFDGEHYTAIAIRGYKDLEQAFFPLYPILISLFFTVFENSFYNAHAAGLLISNISFLLSLFVFYKLLKLDYEKSLSFFILAVFLVFPTSFFFGAIYNESLFLLFVLLSFYFARKGSFLLGSIFAIFASSTRVFGILLFFSLILEVYKQRASLKNYFYILFSPLGTLLYMAYLYFKIGDPIAFYNLQTVVGQHHQKGIVLFPQVLFRYTKILLTVSPQASIYPTLLLEFTTGVLFFVLPIIGYFKKIRLSYLFFAFSGMLLTTIQGSFSSLPRYTLVLFPSFIILGLILDKAPRYLKIVYFLISLSVLIFETMMFIRGYWVA